MEIQVFAWLMDIFLIFTLHIFYRQLLGVKYESRFVLIAGWSACLLFFNVSSYLFDGSTPARCLSAVIINFFLLLFLYNGTIMHKLILAFMLLVNIYSMFLWFLLVKVITIFSLKQSQTKINLTDWIGIFLIPIGSFVICYVAWQAQGQTVNLFQSIILAISLIINMAADYLYRQIQFYSIADEENKLLRQQNEYFQARYEDFEKQWLKLCRIRHDMINNCVLEMDYLEKGEYDLLLEYYRDRIGKIKDRKKVIHTGNIGIDSIVNYKLETAEKWQITVDRTIEIAGKVTIDNRDINILIGNLMDNAIEAVRNINADKRKISLLIRTDNTAFFLEIGNFFKGERIRDADGNFLTNKADKRCHGMGLKGVQEIVRKYNGQMTIDVKENEFNIKVLIYMT